MILSKPDYRSEGNRVARRIFCRVFGHFAITAGTLHGKRRNKYEVFGPTIGTVCWCGKERRWEPAPPFTWELIDHDEVLPQ